MADPKPVVGSYIKAYRSGETQPLTFHTSEISELAKGAAYAAKNFGMPEIGVTGLADRILLEGREDAGTNEFNWNNKKAADLYTKMVNAGFSEKTATYTAAVLDKDQVSKRLGISFDRAWNGTGSNGMDKNESYQDRAARMAGASNDPKNEQFKAYINRAATDSLLPIEKLSQATPLDIVQKLYGIISKDRDEPNIRDNTIGNDGAINISDPFTAVIKNALDKVLGVDTSDGTQQKIKDLTSLTPQRTSKGTIEYTNPMLNEMTVSELLGTIIKGKAGIPFAPKKELLDDPRLNKNISPTLSTILDSIADDSLRQLGIGNPIP
jgi:hypothetical protein